MYKQNILTRYFEGDKPTTRLPESEKTVAAMLDEIYGTYNSTPESLFTGSVLRSEIEKERVLNDLPDLFIASDKNMYNLKKTKVRAMKVMIDHVSFVQDLVIFVDLVMCGFDEQTPRVDRGLRQAIIYQIYMRLSTILNDEMAWQKYLENQAVLKAYHTHVNHLQMHHRPIVATPVNRYLNSPPTPTRAQRQRNSNR